LHHYFEEDLSFGEIAREYSVSRQAIFDSVKHGEDSLETFERALKLVDQGWARWINMGLTPDALAERLSGARAGLHENASVDEKRGVMASLDALIAELRGNAAEED
jgi:predicted DNA-binding protein YlxM (UPF0122 family)